MKSAVAAAVALVTSACSIEDHPFDVSVDAGPGRIVVNPVAPTIAEGQSATVAVLIENSPGGDVMVECETANAAELTANPELLFFNDANAAVPQQVTLAAQSDADLTDEQLMVICAAGNFDNGLVNVTIVDDDMQMILVTPSGTPPIMVGEGSTTNIGVRLSYAPAAMATVAISSTGTAAISVAPGALTFTPGNYSASQVVSVMGLQDADAVDTTAMVVLSAPNAMQVQIPVIVNDDD